MGRPVGKKTSVPKYKIEYLDAQKDNPQWITYECTTYAHASEVLKKNHDVDFTRNILCNLCIQRRNKKHQYANVKVSRV
jgi:hypothetical protein